MSRRGMLGAAVAGAGGLVAAGLFDASSAAASVGDPVTLGSTSNSAGTSETRVTGGSGSAPALSAYSTTSNTAIYGRTSQASGLSGIGSAILGDSLNGIGVQGISSKSSAVYGLQGGASGVTTPYTAAGVSGESNDNPGLLGVSENGVGVYGASGTPTGEGAIPAGVVGDSTDNSGVIGLSYSGAGLIGLSSISIDISAGGTGRFYQAASPEVGPPTGTATEFFQGEQVRDETGSLYLCIASGSPGTWVRVATVPSSGTGGAINVLSQPIRLYDTRSSSTAPAPGSGKTGKLAAKASYSLQVTGVAVNSIAVPAGAAAVVGTLTVTNTVAAGYLSTFPSTAPSNSTLTSSINWSTANLNLAAQVTIGLDSNGKCVIGNGLAGGSNPTDVIFDAVAYIA